MRGHVTRILFLLIFVLLFFYISSDSITIGYGETLSITCSEDNFIIVNFAAFGYFGLDDKSSVQLNIECWIDSTYFLSSICTGHHICQSKVQYSPDLSSKSLRNKCVGSADVIDPALFVQYVCITSTLLSSIQDVKTLDGDHAGGFLTTHDYQLSIKTPEWKRDLPEEYCSQWNLPSVISIPAPQESLGIILKLRDIGELYRTFSNSEDEFDTSYMGVQKPVSKGSLLAPPPAFHCPANSVGTACLSDYLRLDVTTTGVAKQHRLRLEVCPYAGEVGWSDATSLEYSQLSDSRSEGDEFYYGLATAPPNSPALVLGPVYNFTSLDFEINLQLGGAIHRADGHNTSSFIRHGWIKGLLFEYILLHCPQLPVSPDSGIRLAYALHTHNDATGATVAVAEVHCPLDRYFFPSTAELAAVNNISLSLDDFEPLQRHVVLRCNHHTRQWMPGLPPSDCMTREEISDALVALLNSKTTTTQQPTTETPKASSIIDTIATTKEAIDTATTTSAPVATLQAPELVVPPISAAVTHESSGINVGNASLSHGSSAAMGVIFGFILCLLILLIIVFIFRQRLSKLIRSKLVPSSTLPRRFTGSGMFMNTLSGSLTFSRHRKNPYFSPSHHPTVLMSQSAVSIPHSPHQWFEGLNANITKPTSANVSLGNLHTLKPPFPPLPPPPPPGLPTTTTAAPAETVADMELAFLDTYAMQQPLYNSAQQRPISSVTSPNSVSLSTQRQTLLSANTTITNVSTGQPSPGAAIGYRGASADRLAEEFVESADVNQVFSATLPWKSKPLGGVTGGLKRLSTFLRSAISGSSGSFHVNHSNLAQQPTLTSRRSNITGAWPPTPFASSSSTSAANSVGLLSLAQSKSHCTSDATIQPVHPSHGSLGRNSLSQISMDGKALMCQVDPSMCRLSHQNRNGNTLGGAVTAALGGKARRGFRETTPLPPLPLPQHLWDDASHHPQHQQHPQPSTLSGHEVKRKTGTLNADTYLEPIDGMQSLDQSNSNLMAEDLSVTELISGGTFSEDSDTGHQASWPSLSTGHDPNIGSEKSALEIGTATCDENCVLKQTVGAPIALSDPTVSFGNGSFEEDVSSAADYFTYDEGHRSHRRRHDRVIRRPKLSPASPRSRPLSEAMLSNHYYDKSELLNPAIVHGGREIEAGGPPFDFPFRPPQPISRPTSIGVYSNDDEEETDAGPDVDEDSSLYEAVDRRNQKANEIKTSPPFASTPDPLVFPPPARNAVQTHTPVGDRVYKRSPNNIKLASTSASTSTLIADLSSPSRSSFSQSPSPLFSNTSASRTAPYANLRNL